MTKKITFPRWPSEFLPNLCRPVCLDGLIGRHWLADDSEGHRGISKFNAFSSRFYYFVSLENEFSKALFFYYSKLYLHIVMCNRIQPRFEPGRGRIIFKV